MGSERVGGIAGVDLNVSFWLEKKESGADRCDAVIGARGLYNMCQIKPCQRGPRNPPLTPSFKTSAALTIAAKSEGTRINYASNPPHSRNISPSRTRR